MSKQIEGTWYTPDEKLPEVGVFVVATVSGECRNIHFDHALVMAEYWDEGWCVEPFDFNLKGAWLKVHAWCDLEPYGGGA